MPALLGAGVDALRDQDVALPSRAPRTMFNRPVGSARRFVGEAWPHARLQAVARAPGSTANDVGLAMCAGALRAYLVEQQALPDASLVAMVPVSQQSTDPASGATEGNAWAAVLCDLATDLTDPAARVARISASMSRSKALMSRLDAVTSAALSAAVLAGAAPIGLPGGPRGPRPLFNLVISSIPAAREPLYLDGSELTDAYPLSLVVDGQALNITIIRYADRLQFGITGCQRSVPQLQRLAVHLDRALADLEKHVVDRADHGDVRVAPDAGDAG